MLSNGRIDGDGEERLELCFTHSIDLLRFFVAIADAQILLSLFYYYFKKS